MPALREALFKPRQPSPSCAFTQSAGDVTKAFCNPKSTMLIVVFTPLQNERIFAELFSFWEIASLLEMLTPFSSDRFFFFPEPTVSNHNFKGNIITHIDMLLISKAFL